MVQRLFVYGTLGPDGPNRHILVEIGGTWVEASVRGRLEDRGWGAQMGYPAILLDPNAPPVQGHVFVSENLVDHWTELDAFEGSEYQRVLTQVELAGQTVDAYVYAIPR